MSEVFTVLWKFQIVVGAYKDDNTQVDEGGLYIFRTKNDGLTWNRTAELHASDASSILRLGTSVAIDGSIVRDSFLFGFCVYIRSRSSLEPRPLLLTYFEPLTLGNHGVN